MNNQYDKIIEHNGEQYGIKIGEIDNGPCCIVRLLPYEGLLFGSSLEWLIYSGILEDGDATHDVPREAIDKIKSWAKSVGYELQRWM